jgi:hypothetical protein
MTVAPPAGPAWLPALAPFIERDDLSVPLKVPIHLPTGAPILDVPAVSMRFPRWAGEPFVDDFGKKSAGMIELEGEHLFAELAIVRLLEKEGWDARWVNTYSAKGEVWKYLKEWRDVPRNDQRNRVIEEAEPRQLLARVAGLNKPARYAGSWDVFAWRGSDFAFFQTKRAAPRASETLRTEQEDWLRSALYLGDPRLSRRSQSFCVVLWDYL